MNRTFLRNGIVVGALVLALIGAGCGPAPYGGNESIQIPNILKLDNATLTATVGSGRAVASSHGTVAMTFPDLRSDNLDRLTGASYVNFYQAIEHRVKLSVPGTSPMPERFTLTNFQMSGLTIKDPFMDAITLSNGVVNPSQLTYQRVSATSNEYEATEKPDLNSGIDFDTQTYAALYTTLSQSGSPNMVNVTISFDANDSELPVGSTLTFTLSDGYLELTFQPAE